MTTHSTHSLRGRWRDEARLRICLVANARFPIRQPFIGGLESMTWHLARGLRRRGHEVALFAAPGSDPALDVEKLPLTPTQGNAGRRHSGRNDVDAPEWIEASEHVAYQRLLADLSAGERHFDVLHNNSLHPLPLAEAASLPMPVLTTLHTPPLAAMEKAIRTGGGRPAFTAVSEFTARSWAPLVDASCVPNGVDTDLWPAGPGGDTAVWSGRLVPEKAPHQAIDAARHAGVALVLAGPVLDDAYFAAEIRPRLGGRVICAGHLRQPALAQLVGRSSVAVVTPDWDEPFGLVAAEALACGTPVAAYARGGLPEVVGRHGSFAPAGDVVTLGQAIREARGLDRRAARRHAERHLSVATMVERYEDHYRLLLDTGVAA
ncbi:glycosyltransferase [Nocardioides sp. Y6]|uniref:Glycosyltransferase n=1 Tax=Nocardioides malaquae TaxID=2773426 RepID=A0ABR9RVY8_9ACTN|nr:glycosyltransferase [Nocardioides malaquae]MBE7325722.1 glycosyltransferase [Nocardioides malaquae]